MRVPKKKVELKVLGNKASNGTEPLWDLYKEGVTQGFLAKLLSCPERARLSMLEGLSFTSSKGALAFGTVFHSTLDKVYTKTSKAGRFTDIRKYLPSSLEEVEKEEYEKLKKLSKMPTNAEDDLAKILSLAEVLLEGYFKQYRSDRRIKWVCLETEFDIKYYPRIRLELDVEPIRIRGKWDGIYQEGEYDKLRLFETKTRGTIDEGQIHSLLHYDLQVCLYLWAIRAQFGYIPTGVLYNVVRRPNLQQSQKETYKKFLDRVRADINKRPDHYYLRFDSSVSLEEMKTFELELDRIMFYVIEWYEGKYNYRNSTACTGRLGPCEFLPLCGRNERSYYIKREHAFPELVGEE